VTRLTSGDTFFASQDTKREVDEDNDLGNIIGLTYTAKDSSEVCQAADPAKEIE
jgi:hypothetical protein